MKRHSIWMVLLLALALTVPGFAHEEGEEAHKDVIRRLVEEGLDGANPDVLDEIYTSDALIHLPPSFNADPITPEAFKFIITSINEAMPDFTPTLDIVIASGDWAAYRLTWHGTFENPMPRPSGSAFEPTGNPIELSFNTISRFNEDDKIVEEWTEFDNLSWLTQLGLIPMPEGEEAAQETIEEAAAQPVEIMDIGMEEELADRIQEVVEQAFNQGNVAVIDEVYTADYISHPPETVEEFKQAVVALRAAMPDLQAAAGSVVVEGNLAAFRFTMRGTFTNELALGELPTLPPTGQPIELAINIFLRFNEQGQVVEEWDELDNLGWLTQLGVIPAPES